MNTPRRAALLLFAVLGSIGLLFLALRHGPKPATRAREQAPSADEHARVLPVPSQPVVVERLLPAAAPAAASVPSAAEPSDDSLAAAMHALEDSAPERALELARRGQALWPAGPRAAEFAATEVKCLYRLGRPSEGRGAAEAMVNKYPTTSWALEVERQTGAHPYLNH